MINPNRLLSLDALRGFTIALMIVASAFHIARGEGSQIGFNIFVAILAAFIAWGRQRRG